ncbi:hypothetical protein [Larkinella punicea]|uniref:hypothetical protein n=1 Tax=Larkinella punicea TaxID=2315727 RepID=UPI001E51F935|nr:hypothetical protein [Larkinella punicea]
MKPVAKTVRKKKLPDQQFGFGVFAADLAHVEAPLLGGMYISHITRSFRRCFGRMERQCINLPDVFFVKPPKPGCWSGFEMVAGQDFKS